MINPINRFSPHENSELQQQEKERIQFSSPSVFFGGPGMLSRTSRASWDLFTMTSLSLTAVCILLTLEWSLKEKKKHTIIQLSKPLRSDRSASLSVLTAWCSACLWSLRAWSSRSAPLCTGPSSLWSRSSGRDGGARSCCSPAAPALRRRCRPRRLTRCWSGAAWSCGPSPTGPASHTETNMDSARITPDPGYPARTRVRLDPFSYFFPKAISRSSATNLLTLNSRFFLALCLFVPVCLCLLWWGSKCGLQYSWTWARDTPKDNTRSPNLLKKPNTGCTYSIGKLQEHNASYGAHLSKEADGIQIRRPLNFSGRSSRGKLQKNKSWCKIIKRNYDMNFIYTFVQVTGQNNSASIWTVEG